MSPRIYVACLAAYNNGILHGDWIDANQEPCELRAAIERILKASPVPHAEEWAVHDYEGFYGISLSEWSGLHKVSKLAELIEDHGEAFALWYQSQDGSYFETDQVEDKFLEQWQGVHDSESAFADYLLEETGQLSNLPKWARNYFDFAGYARDLRLSGDYSFVSHQGQVYVYSND